MVTKSTQRRKNERGTKKPEIRSEKDVRGADNQERGAGVIGGGKKLKSQVT